MKKIITLFIVGFIIFNIYRHKLKSESDSQEKIIKNLYKDKYKDKLKNNSNNSFSENVNNLNNNLNNNQSCLKSNLREDFDSIRVNSDSKDLLGDKLSKIAIEILKTETGRSFFENLISINNPLIPYYSNNSGSDFGNDFGVYLDKENGFYLDNRNLIDNMFEVKKFKPKVGDIDVIDNVESVENNKVICGQNVFLEYQIFNNDHTEIDSYRGNLVVGSEIGLPIGHIIVGMEKGEIRSANIKTNLLRDYHNNIEINSNYENNQTDKFKVKIFLKEIISDINTDDISMFDDKIGYKLPILCGGYVSFHVLIRRLSNQKIIFDSREKLFDGKKFIDLKDLENLDDNDLDLNKISNYNRKIKMRIGDHRYPILFSYALNGKIPIGKRTVIAKGKHMKSFYIKNNLILPNNNLKDDEYVMVEFFDFE